jgi:hypothetical protein
MPYEDYLMREIAKIGAMLRAILGIMIRRKENFAITIEDVISETKDKLLTELNFDLDLFLAMNDQDSKEYLSKYQGFNAENLELLGDVLYKFGLQEDNQVKNLYLEKSLQVYKTCNSMDKTFSIERQKKVKLIEDLIKVKS